MKNKYFTFKYITSVNKFLCINIISKEEGGVCGSLYHSFPLLSRWKAKTATIVHVLIKKEKYVQGFLFVVLFPKLH